jgi:hypothetical protein
MSIAPRTVIVAVICSLAACTTPTTPAANPEPGETHATVSELTGSRDDAPTYIARAVIAPTPAMLKAALANDPDAMRDAVVASVPAGCQAASTCPAQFGACTNWSTTTLCNETCGVGVCICRPIIDCDGEPPETKGRDTFNSFRVCFDSNQNACTEWSSTTSTFCGC